MPLHGLTIAFDLDGTLVDTAPDLIGALNVVLTECDLPALPLVSARWLVGRGAQALIERGFATSGEVLDSRRTPGLVARFIEIYRDRIADESRPFDGVEEALDALSDAGARLCVCTNKPTELSNRLLSALGMTARFGSIVGADAAPRPKPDPSHLLHAVKLAGGRADAAIMVGDSETDMATARNAKIPVIAVPFGYTELSGEDLQADVLITHYRELGGAVLSLLPTLNLKDRSAIGSPSRALDLDA